MKVQDDDIERLMDHAGPGLFGWNAEETTLQTDRWREEEPWLLLPIAALTFRRGLLAAVLCLGLHWPDPLLAMEWDDMWFNPNQRGAKAMVDHDYPAAAAVFSDLEWKAAAHYGAGEFDEAAENLRGVDTPAATYNRGNALARSGRTDEAIESYEQTLAHDPGHDDARFNLEILKKLMQRQSGQPDQPKQDQNSTDQQQSGQEQQVEGPQQQEGSSDANSERSPDEGRQSEYDQGSERRSEQARQDRQQSSDPPKEQQQDQEQQGQRQQ